MRTLTDQVIAVLQAGGLVVGDGTGEGLTPPFVVVYPLVQLRDGAIGAGYEWSEVDKAFQVTCEATSRRQAEWLADRVDDLMLAADLVVRLLARPEVRRDDTTADPSRWKAWPRYAIDTYL